MFTEYSSDLTASDLFYAPNRIRSVSSKKHSNQRANDKKSVRLAGATIVVQHLSISFIGLDKSIALRLQNLLNNRFSKYCSFESYTCIDNAIPKFDQANNNVLLLFQDQWKETECLQALQAVRNADIDSSVLFLCTEDERGVASETIQHGAQDWLVVDELNSESLWKAVVHASERQQYLQQFRTIVEELLSSQTTQEESLGELEAANRELKERSEQYQIAGETKNSFLAHMSHEVRTPLTAILGYADVLIDRLSAPDDIFAAQTIRKNGAHLLTIFSDVFTISKLDSSQFTLDKTSVSPLNITEEVMQLMESQALEKGLNLNLEVQGILPATIETDPTRLRQVLLNLIGNAIACTEHGEVCLLVRFECNESKSAQLVFDVVDTGLGISEEEQENLFELFTITPRNSKSLQSGSSLGLAISKKLASLLGGTLAVQSERGEGSKFSLTLNIPLDRVDLSTKQASDFLQGSTKMSQTPARTFPKLNCRILFAEDGPDNQRLVSYMLKKAGVEVTIVENGKDAVGKAMLAFQGEHRRHDDPVESFDLILMDMQMPVMDGYEATKELRRLGFKQPIIALTAHSMSYDRQKCIDAGCNDYISKPIDREIFFRILVEQLASTRAEKTLRQES